MIALKIPNLGENIADATIITVHLTENNQVHKGDIILELETDKATLEVPADKSGKITKVLVKVGDKVSQGKVVAELETHNDEAKQESVVSEISTPKKLNSDPKKEQQSASSSTKEILLPNLGDGITEVGVLKVLIKKGQKIQEGDILLEIETDKATLEVPAKENGTIQEIFIQEGQKIKIESKIFTLKTTAATTSNLEQTNSTSQLATQKEQKPELPSKIEASPNLLQQVSESKILSHNKILVPASPIVRRFAREIGVDLTQVQGSLAGGRIAIEDVKIYVKQKNQSSTQATSSLSLPDFSPWGKTLSKDLSNIKKVTAKVMTQTWQNIPHVTNFHEADITDLENASKKYTKTAEKKGVKLTATIFLTKACAFALQKFTHFNASYNSNTQELIVKNYFHLALAVDTKKGLVVPVIRDVDKKELFTLAMEIANISEKARAGKLSLEEMKGQSFTISSMGGVGNVRHFTPIINYPDVAILGISRSSQQARYINGELVPRTILPISLSYDHRVIDGAEATRFMNYLVAILEEPFFPIAL